MNELLILVAVISFCVNSIMTRLFQVVFPNHIRHIRVYQSLFCLTASVAFFIVSGCRINVGTSVALFGALFGALFYITVMCYAIGFEIGSMSLTGIIVNLSMLIPIIYSCIALGEKITAVEIVGIALIFVVMVLSSLGDGKGEDKKSVSVIWIIVVFIALIANGFSATVQKHALSTYGDSIGTAFLCIAYFVSAVCFAVSYFSNISGFKGNQKLSKKVFLGSLLLAIPSGLGSWGGNALLGYLCVKVDGAILYPFLNGGICILTALTSFIFFKEKVTLKKIIIILIGIAAIVILNIPA